MNLFENKAKEKEMMIKDIAKYSDLFNDEEELNTWDYKKLKSIYYSCLIPVFKGKTTSNILA